MSEFYVLLRLICLFWLSFPSISQIGFCDLTNFSQNTKSLEHGYISVCRHYYFNSKKFALTREPLFASSLHYIVLIVLIVHAYWF